MYSDVPIFSWHKLVLNSANYEECNTIIDCKTLISSLRSLSLKLKSEYMSACGDLVDYAALRSSSVFNEYMNTAKLLSRIDLESINDPLELKAFYINIYNSLVIHGMTVERIFTVTDEKILRKLFYSTTCYKIGNYVYSLDDIEHGLLRCNKRSASSPYVSQFSDYDPRLIFMSIEPGKRLNIDPRIHFALNCGAKSCPPIMLYKSEIIDNQLELACKSYLAESVYVNKQVDEISIEYTITLPMLLNWYAEDFGDNNVELLHWIIPYLKDEEAMLLNELFSNLCSGASVSYRIQYTPYDWTRNNYST